MNARTNRIFMTLMATILAVALFAGVVNARNASPAPAIKPSLSNVRDYAAAVAETNYAVDGGVLFQGRPNGWMEMSTPDNIIVSAVAIDEANPQTLYIGAADALVIYRSTDGGQNWLRVPLTEEYIGGVTDIAVDSAQRLVYVGTDTAGLFRLRDVGSSMVVSAHLALNEAVIEVAADSTGAGLAFARTNKALYRGENYGLAWSPVDNLGSTPTAVVIADTQPATIYVGTMDRGLVKSNDGLTWTTANEGLGFVPGSRLQVDALSIDPQQPSVLYVATSYLYGSTELHQSPVGVAMSTNAAASWSVLYEDRNVAITSLLPVSGQTGAVYALSNVSRTPAPLGNAPVVPAEVAATTVEAAAPSLAWTTLAAWVIAGLAALALMVSIVLDLRNRRLAPSQTLAAGAMRNR